MLLMELLLDNIQRHVSISEEEKSLISSYWIIKQLNRGEHLLEEGTVCRYGAFVLAGSLKGYIIHPATGNEEIVFLAIADWEPILSGKKMIVFTSSGEFDFQKGRTREAFNHLVPHIKSCAHYLGVTNEKDFYHVAIEYQEFKDNRHEQSKKEAFGKIAGLIDEILATEPLSNNPT
jgi:hypothetical protein